MSVRGRLGDAVAGRVRGRLDDITQASELDAVAARIERLEVAVAENVDLEAPLARIVSDLERTVAGVVARASGDEVGP